jgi:hypothetical protein
MHDPRLPVIPDDWAVWAFSDAHGVTSGVIAALQRAGLVDEALHWIAPPRTALVGCGDYLDRGQDVAGLVALLQRLQTDARTHGGRVLLARGNHEAMPLIIRGGDHRWLDTWREYGGDATLTSYACADAESADAARVVAGLASAAPGLFDWLAALPHAVCWRDVLFVHGGLPPGYRPADLGTRTEEHLWIRSAFFDTPWDDAAFDGYRAAGIERVVFGHTPQWSGPTFHHGGRSLGIDTNAVGNPRMPAGAVSQVTMLGLAGTGDLGAARLLEVDTSSAPERMRRRAEPAPPPGH